jgi:hypothetical protein
MADLNFKVKNGLATSGPILVNLGTALSNGPTIELINTNGANGTIHARGSSATDGVFISATDNNYFATPTYRTTQIGQFGASATGTTGGISNASLGILSFQNTSAGLIYTNGQNPIIFGTTNVERMRINPTGGVEINGKDIELMVFMGAFL